MKLDIDLSGWNGVFGGQKKRADQSERVAGTVCVSAEIMLQHRQYQRLPLLSWRTTSEGWRVSLTLLLLELPMQGQERCQGPMWSKERKGWQRRKWRWAQVNVIPTCHYHRVMSLPLSLRTNTWLVGLSLFHKSPSLLLERSSGKTSRLPISRVSMEHRLFPQWLSLSIILIFSILMCLISMTHLCPVQFKLQQPNNC